LLALLPEDWGIVLWGWNFDSFLWAEIPEGVARCRIEISQPELRANLEVFRREKRPHAPIRLRHTFGVMAYTLSPRGAEAMLATCSPITDRIVEFPGFDIALNDGPVDIGMNRVYPTMPSYVCMPPLAVSENLHEESHTR
jgi:glycosyl transferase family 25